MYTAFNFFYFLFKLNTLVFRVRTYNMTEYAYARTCELFILYLKCS